MKGILRLVKLTGKDKLTKTKVEFDQLKKLGYGTVFLDATIKNLGAVKFEDQCMTPKDRNKKRECQVTLVFPRLDLTGKVYWFEKWIISSWFMGTDIRYETSRTYDYQYLTIIKIAFVMQ